MENHWTNFGSWSGFDPFTGPILSLLEIQAINNALADLKSQWSNAWVFVNFGRLYITDDLSIDHRNMARFENYLIIPDDLANETFNELRQQKVIVVLLDGRTHIYMPDRPSLILS